MLPAGHRPATSWVHYTTSCNTQSSAPEDGRNHRLKNVELIGINSKPLLLHLVGCVYYLYQRCTVKQISNLKVRNFNSCFSFSANNSVEWYSQGTVPSISDSVNVVTRITCLVQRIWNYMNVEFLYWTLAAFNCVMKHAYSMRLHLPQWKRLYTELRYVASRAFTFSYFRFHTYAVR